MFASLWNERKLIVDPNRDLLCPVCSASNLIWVNLQGTRVSSFARRNELSTEGANVFYPNRKISVFLTIFLYCRVFLLAFLCAVILVKHLSALLCAVFSWTKSLESWMGQESLSDAVCSGYSVWVERLMEEHYKLSQGRDSLAAAYFCV